ncbi:hypothetical protein G5V59_19455 [Nocardioides sp. W3-2-3]|nr:hypothetical protein [Nocardioides convexus]
MSALVLGTSACSRDDAGDRPPLATQTAMNGDVFNDADAEFATAFVQHHAAVLALVDLASDHQAL